MTRSHLIIALLAFATLPAHAALPGNAAEGKKLHDAHCTGCHDTSVYTRKDRQVKTLDALKDQLAECTHAAQVTLDDKQMQDLLKYMSERFYKFT